MRRRVLRIVGLTAAAIFFAASLARAQEERGSSGASLGFPEVPKFESPAATPADGPKADIPVSPNTGLPRLEQLRGGNIGIAQVAFSSGEEIDARYIENSQHPDDAGIWETWRAGTGAQLNRILKDYQNFYLSENLLYVGVSVAVAAPLANTNADQGIRNWYQRGAGQANAANSAANIFKEFGAVGYALPIYGTFAVTEFVFPECETLQTLGEFSWRSLRALTVGAPTVGILAYGLGSGSPEGDDSRWHPLRSSGGVSTHAFVGAIPFLTAASMTDNAALQTLLFAGSVGPAWSRIQTDNRYLSQVLLGWSIAFLSVQSVNLTESQSHRLNIVPIDVPKGVGLGLEIRY